MAQPVTEPKAIPEAELAELAMLPPEVRQQVMDQLLAQHKIDQDVVTLSANGEAQLGTGGVQLPPGSTDGIPYEAGALSSPTANTDGSFEVQRAHATFNQLLLYQQQQAHHQQQQHQYLMAQQNYLIAAASLQHATSTNAPMEEQQQAQQAMLTAALTQQSILARHQAQQALYKEAREQVEGVQQEARARGSAGAPELGAVDAPAASTSSAPAGEHQAAAEAAGAGGSGAGLGGETGLSADKPAATIPSEEQQAAMVQLLLHQHAQRSLLQQGLQQPLPPLPPPVPAGSGPGMAACPQALPLPGNDFMLAQLQQMHGFQQMQTQNRALATAAAAAAAAGREAGLLYAQQPSQGADAATPPPAGSTPAMGAEPVMGSDGLSAQLPGALPGLSAPPHSLSAALAAAMAAVAGAAGAGGGGVGADAGEGGAGAAGGGPEAAERQVAQAVQQQAAQVHMLAHAHAHAAAAVCERRGGGKEEQSREYQAAYQAMLEQQIAAAAAAAALGNEGGGGGGGGAGGGTAPPPLSVAAMAAGLKRAAADEPFGPAVGSDGKRLKTASAPVRPSNWTEEQDRMLCEIVVDCGAREWKRISAKMQAAEPPGRGDFSDVQCLHRWNKVLKPGLKKGPWTKAEDAVVLDLVQTHGVGKIKWSQVADKLPGRIGKQCRERWFNHLDKQINKTEWDHEENMRLYRLQVEHGNKWSSIAKVMEGRTENGVKNRFNSSAFKKWATLNGFSLSGTCTRKKRRDGGAAAKKDSNARAAAAGRRAADASAGQGDDPAGGPPPPPPTTTTTTTTAVEVPSSTGEAAGAAAPESDPQVTLHLEQMQQTALPAFLPPDQAGSEVPGVVLPVNVADPPGPALSSI